MLFKKQTDRISFGRIVLAVLLLLLIVNNLRIPPEDVPVIHAPFIGTQAKTTPVAILVQNKDVSDHILAHERCHVRQSNRYGKVWTVVLNAYYSYKYGYNDNPFEKQAFNFSGMCEQDKRSLENKQS